MNGASRPILCIEIGGLRTLDTFAAPENAPFRSGGRFTY